MVLVRKLKQMGSLDERGFRGSFGWDDSASDAPRVPKLDLDVDDHHASANTRRRRTPSPPRRPVTRSQTYGHPPPFRRRLGDSADEIQSIATIDNPSPPEQTPTESSPEPEPLPTEKVDSVVESQAPVSQFTFLGVSSPERRGPRSRAVLPVPVPNLTKKSRGRRVPTKPATDNKEGPQKVTRIYVCKVEDCGKCFNRGEHLKRHIRSIHTHEKPFQCPYPACDKFFNRHDNLLQHLKVHKDHPLSQNRMDSRQISTPVTSDKSPPPAADTLNASYYQTSPSYTTNMAVSSLRTELIISSRDTSPHLPANDEPGQPRPRPNDDSLSSRTILYRTQPQSTRQP